MYGPQQHTPYRSRVAPAGAHSFGLLTYTPDQDDLAVLRGQQVAFRQVVRDESRRNSWMAVPALAPFGMVALAELGTLGASALASQAARLAPLHILRAEKGLAAGTSGTLARPLSRAERTGLRDKARERFAQAYGGYARDWAAHVHHRIALRYAHLMPRADPNRLANLQGLEKLAHGIATRAEEAFVRSLAGRPPTQAEIVAHALRVDKLIEPYILRGTVSRPILPPTPKPPVK